MRAVALGIVLLTLSGLTLTRAARGDAGVPALRARFAMTRADGRTEHLELLRVPDRVEHRFVERGYSELWRRDARGELEHVRSFPGDGKAVHYTAGDLSTIHLAPDWRALESLLGASELSALREVGRSRSAKAGSLRMLSGTLRGQPARVSWRDDVALPAQLALGEGKSKVVISLLSVTACTSDSCAGEDTSSLRSIEFADLGDMEYDPFVRRFLAHEGGHAHGGH
jgi:hypothetical protein